MKFTMLKIYKKGFIATISVILLSIGALSFVSVVLLVASSYADTIERKEIRIQRDLNKQSCQKISPMIFVRDYFFEGEIKLSNFDCIIHK